MEALLELCPVCGGTGQRPQEPLPRNVISRYGDFTCSKCGGSGKLLTESGKLVQEVIDRYERLKQSGRAQDV